MRRPRSQNTDAAPSNVRCWSIAAASVPAPPTTAPARTIGRQPVVAPAHAEGQPGGGPQGDDERADQLDRQRIVAEGDDRAGDGEDDGDRGDEQAVRRPQRGERRRGGDGGRGGWQGRLDDGRHHHLSGHHGPLRGQGCCHRRPGGASHTPSQPSTCRRAARTHVLDGADVLDWDAGSFGAEGWGDVGGAAGGELGEGEGDGDGADRDDDRRPPGQAVLEDDAEPVGRGGPDEPADDDPERHADEHAGTTIVTAAQRAADRAPAVVSPSARPMATSRRRPRSTVTSRVQQAGDGERAEERGQQPWHRAGLVQVVDLRRQRRRAANPASVSTASAGRGRPSSRAMTYCGCGSQP